MKVICSLMNLEKKMFKKKEEEEEMEGGREGGQKGQLEPVPRCPLKLLSKSKLWAAWPLRWQFTCGTFHFYASQCWFKGP